MKQQWEQLTGKIDALSLRERGIMLILVSFVIIFLFDSWVIEPQFAKQKILSNKIKQEQGQVSALNIEIIQREAGVKLDPDADIKRRISNAQQQLSQIDSNLQGLQKNLVRPEKMISLLENILKRNQKLQLVSLKSLPTTNVIDEMDTSGGASIKTLVTTSVTTNLATNSNDLSTSGAIYKHEVEIVMQGSYLDMLSYMRELESLPEQVYWSKGKLTVIEYPKASLTLNLFTLSLEKKWLNL